MRERIVKLEKVRHAKSFFQKMRGLIGEKSSFDYCLVFHLNEETKIGASIHMLFMRMPIDVFWLNRKRKIVDMKEHLKPWVLNVTPKARASYIVEGPKGFIHNHRLSLGQRVSWQD